MTRYRSENGSIIPYVAIFGVMIFIFVALSIDTTFLTDSSVQYQRLADAAALSVAREYRESTETDPVQRLNDAIAEAGKLVDSNLKLSLVEGRFLNRQSDYSGLLTLAPAGDDDVAVVTPGTWHFRHSTNGGSVDVDECYTDPSNKTEDTFKQCFEPVSGTETPTAFRVDFFTANSSPLRTYLSSFFGQDTGGVGASSIAAQVPRRAVFAVDTTASTYSDTHFIFDASNNFVADASTYVYDINPAATVSYDGRAGMTLPDPFNDVEPAFVWNDLLPDGPNQPGHDKSDFITVRVNYRNTSVGMDVEREFLVDFREKPEPFSQILDAVNSAFVTFQNRAVVGDRVGYLGFDSELIEERSGNSNYSLVIPEACPASCASIGVSEFCRLQCATNPFYEGGSPAANLANARTQLFVNKFLFPRFAVDGDQDGTNIPQALASAYSSLNSTEGVGNSDNYIVMFSDGQSNCAIDSVAPLTDFVRSTCGITNQAHENSLQQAVDSIVPAMRAQDIKVVFALIGTDAEPHHVAYSNGGVCTGSDSFNCCMSLNTYKRRVQTGAIDKSTNPWVQPETLVDPAASYQPSSWPNSWYQVVEETDGVWIPVMPPCSNFSNLPLSDADRDQKVFKAISQYCGSFGNNLRVTGPSDLSGTPLASAFASPSAVLNNVIDAQGRLLCDIQSRTVAEQLEDPLTQEILGQNPYVLVR